MRRESGTIMPATPLINGMRLLERLDTFAAIGATPEGGVDRQALTEGDRRARAYLADIAIARGYAVSQDSAANLFVRRPGHMSDTPPFLIGSHFDTQPSGGRFDGALGVLAGLEVLESLDDAGIKTAAPLELVVWTNEEGCRFAPGSMGAQAFVNGKLSDALLASNSTDGAVLAEELAITLGSLPQAQPCPLGKAITGYLELHIEQAPHLECLGIPIGVVTGVQGVRWLQVRVTGDSGHAGTTPLSRRRDPMRAVVTGLARLYETIMPADAEARFTVGRMTAEPGSVNTIPAVVVFSIDIRHPAIENLDAMETGITIVLQQAAEHTGCTITIDRIFDMAPTRFAEPLLECIEDVAESRGVASTRMVSGAFHDALFVSRIAPTAMIFVPCREGISHNAREYVEPEFCVLGAEVLLHSTLRGIAASMADAGPVGKIPAIDNNQKGMGT